MGRFTPPRSMLSHAAAPQGCPVPDDLPMDDAESPLAAQEFRVFARRALTRRTQTAVASPADDRTALVSTQPVFDHRANVVGHRIAYALKDGAALSWAHPALLLDTALSVIGLQELVGDGVAHVP